MSLILPLPPFVPIASGAGLLVPNPRQTLLRDGIRHRRRPLLPSEQARHFSRATTAARDPRVAVLDRFLQKTCPN